MNLGLGFWCLMGKSTGLKAWRRLQWPGMLVEHPTTSFSPMQVLLKLFSYCVKVKVNRQQLVKLEMNTLNVMLGTLNLVRFPSWGGVGGPTGCKSSRHDFCKAHKWTKLCLVSCSNCCSYSLCWAEERQSVGRGSLTGCN